MRKKRTSTFKLHSIPIISNNSKLRYISYSIPLASICALLLVFSMTTSPDLQTLFFVSDSNSVYAINDNSSSLDSSTDSSNDSNDSNDNNSDESNGNDADIALLEDNPSSASITIGGAKIDEEVMTAPGTTAYRSHDVTINVSKAKAYTLTISGPAEMTPPAPTTKPITGADGAIGSDMVEYTWGYYWGTSDANADTVDNASRPYASVIPTGTGLIVPELSSDNTANFTRKLVFAAKFGKSAVAGLYTAPVTLSLAVTPKETGNFWKNELGSATVYDAGSTSMQGISEGFCKGNDEIKAGWTVKLRDTREASKSYTVVKLPDGSCWMQENLTLPGGTNAATGGTALTMADTDNPANGSWGLPTTAWADTNTEGRVIIGSTSLNGWQVGYGNYYNWFAVTAGAGTTSVESTDAPGSICPRNWKLPTKTQFDTLATYAKTMDDITSGYYKFPAAGDYSGSLNAQGGIGQYWSSTAASDNNGAYRLVFSNSGVTTTYSYRYTGYSVRCVARY